MGTGLVTRRASLSMVAGALAASPLIMPHLALAASVPPAPTLPEAEFTPEEATALLEAMEDRQRRMTAPVMVNDRGPFDFMVDTGTNRSVISNELVESMGLAMGGQVRIHGIAGEQDTGTVTLDRFGVGGRVARKLSLPCLPQRWLGGPGILGVDGLKNQRVVMDLEAAKLRIEPSGAKAQDIGRTMIRARRRFGQLTVVDTDLEGVQVAVMIDTGGEVTIGNSALRRAVGERRARAGLPSNTETNNVMIEGATGEKFMGEYGAVPHFRMGELNISNLRVIYADLHPFKLWDLQDKPAMLMAMDVIRFFKVMSLDFGRNEVRFDLPAQPYIDPAGALKRS